MGPDERRTRARLPASIWALGLVSLLMDVSSEMIHSLLPLFMAGTLGVSAFTIGLIEGLAESTALIVKVFSGASSDWLGRRKGLALAGYALGALTKPLFAIATGAGLVVTARPLDRVGNGIRGAPRDALVADIAPPEARGAAFGLRQSLDTVGAFLGPLLAAGLMLLWADDFRAVFRVAVVPGLAAVLVLAIGVREPARRVGEKRVNHSASAYPFGALAGRVDRATLFAASAVAGAMGSAFGASATFWCGAGFASPCLAVVAARGRDVGEGEVTGS